MTFSIIGRCENIGHIGIAISSSSIAVGARCPWLRSGVGAVATQNITLPAYGPNILDLLAQGLSPEKALKKAIAQESYSAYRQMIVMNLQGDTAAFSGTETLGVHHSVRGHQCVAAGNMLHAPEVIAVMTATFEQHTGDLADRLLAAMQSGLREGGEAGPVHSAALAVVDHRVVWPMVDLRVDWDEMDPIATLGQLWQAYKPQMQDYITRAQSPDQAPSYGVPGDE